MNYVNSTGKSGSPSRYMGGQFEIALMLLEAGSDHRIYEPKSNSRLIHTVLAKQRRSAAWTPQQRDDYQKLLGRLIDH